MCSSLCQSLRLVMSAAESTDGWRTNHEEHWPCAALRYYGTRNIDRSCLDNGLATTHTHVSVGPVRCVLDVSFRLCVRACVQGGDRKRPSLSEPIVFSPNSCSYSLGCHQCPPELEQSVWLAGLADLLTDL